MSEKLERAIQAIQAKEKESGKKLLLEIIKQDPNNEMAWLWMSNVMTTDVQRRQCLERVLKINPNNNKAKKGLAILDRRVGQKSSSTKHSKKSQDEQRQAPLTLKVIAFVGIPLAILFACGMVGAAAYLALTPSVKSSAQNVAQSATVAEIPPVEPTPQPNIQLPMAEVTPQATPTATPVVAITFTPTPTPIDLARATRSAELGISNAPPTATPPGEDISDPHYLQGKNAYQAKNYEETLNQMTQVLATNPNLAPPYWYRGMTYFYLKDYQSGLAEMNQALGIDPNYALVYADRGLIQANMGNESEAMADYQKALSLDPTLAKVHHNIAAIYVQHKDYFGALAEFDAALAIDPNRASTLAHRSGVFLELGDYQKCLEGTNRAIKLDSKFWQAYYFRGTCLANLQKFDAAVRDLSVYVDAIPDDPQGWYNRGLANENFNNFKADDEALSDYTKAIELKPDFVAAHINRGNMYLKHFKFINLELALADFNVALTVEESPAAYNGRGDVYLAQGRTEDALRDYQRAVELSPNYYNAYTGIIAAATTIARKHLEQKNYGDALTMATYAHETHLKVPDNDNSFPLQIIGRVYYEQGDFYQAIIYLTEAIKTSRFLSHHYYRGLALEANGQIEDAIRDYHHVVDHAASDDDLTSADTPGIVEASHLRLAELEK